MNCNHQVFQMPKVRLVKACVWICFSLEFLEQEVHVMFENGSQRYSGLYTVHLV